MKVLIIEDDQNKRDQIKALITKTYKGCKIFVAKSYHSGLQMTLKTVCDIVLLDMTMPTYDITVDEDGGRPQHYAGREILRQMDRRKVVLPVLVITQFDVFGEGPDTLTRQQLHDELMRDHPLTYKGMVYYNAASDTWISQLVDLIEEILP
jgi:CheY-like chemotaxis protein